MSGFVICYGTCLNCRTPFSFNPHKVPSMRRTPESPREPLCQSCVDAFNAHRKQIGMEQFVIPLDAYAAIPEEEL
jgi:hypothetical protein